MTASLTAEAGFILAQIDFDAIVADQSRVILTGIGTILALIALLLLVRRIRRRSPANDDVPAPEAPLPTPEEAGKTTLMSGIPQAALVGLEPHFVSGQQFILNRPVNAIGRSSRENHIRISDPSISRHHARIYVRDGDFIIRDLNSPNYNPSVVNGNTLDGETILQSGDRIKMGASLFEFIRLDP